MSAGFVFQNKAGEIVIDDRFRCFQITAEGTFTVTSGAWQIFTITYPSRPASFVCIKALQNVKYLTGKPSATQTKLATSLGNGSTIEWKVAAIASDGLVDPNVQAPIGVYDASGREIYSSDRKAARVAAFVPGTGLIPPRTTNDFFGNNGYGAEMNGDGRPNWTRIRHSDLSVPFDTFWSVRQCGSYPRGGGNHNFYPFQRTSTTAFQFELTPLSDSYIAALDTGSLILDSDVSIATGGRLVLK